jgi:putative addiction module CopG family antidote
MNIDLPDDLKSFVDEQISERGYGTSSEYVRELIRKCQDRLQLRVILDAPAVYFAADQPPPSDRYTATSDVACATSAWASASRADSVSRSASSTARKSVTPAS